MKMTATLIAHGAIISTPALASRHPTAAVSTFIDEAAVPSYPEAAPAERRLRIWHHRAERKVVHHQPEHRSEPHRTRSADKIKPHRQGGGAIEHVSTITVKAPQDALALAAGVDRHVR